MKHSSSRALYAIWDKSRGTERAPYRSDLAPDMMRELLGDMFVINFDRAAGYPLRVAGTKMCALFGREPKGDGFISLFASADRGALTDLVDEVAHDLVAAVVGVAAVGGTGACVTLEMLLLPFRPRAHAPLSLTGLLVPMAPVEPPLSGLRLTSHRYMGHRAEKLVPRALRKLALARGLVVYEGLTGREQPR